MRVLVCGSTTFRGYTQIYKALKIVNEMKNIEVVINGAAPGADSLSTRAARQLGIKFEEYPADWTKYKRGAGKRRNHEMLKEGGPDLVLAFYDKFRTPGTSHMVKIAKEAGVAVKEYGLVAG